MRMWRLIWLYGWLLLPLTAWADTTIRFGEHPGFGRVVIEAEHADSLSVSRQGDRLVVGVAAGALPPPAKLPRNVRAVEYGAAAVSLTLAPGASFRRMLVNHHLVLDILDPATKLPKPLPTKPLASRPPAIQLPPARAVVSPPAPLLVAEQPSLLASPPVPSPAMPALQTAPLPPPLPIDPASLIADIRSVPEAGPGHLLVIPFAMQVGAAAFRRGDDAVVVFDERKPIDLQAVAADPIFGKARVQLLPNATVLHIPLPPAAELRLEHQHEGWVLTAIGGDAMPAALQALMPEMSPEHVLIPAQQPGLVVSVPDSLTGAALLVGTQRSSGQGVMVARRTPDFDLLASWQGVVVAAVSDALVLRATADGFEIGSDGAGQGLAVSPPEPSLTTAAEASRMTRIFDLPRLRTQALIRRMQGAVQSAAEAPEQTKATARRHVAEAMLALGMGAEAQSVLALAATGDARSEDNPKSRGLSALASLLAGRVADAAALDDPALDGSDEINLWRAVRTAMQREAAPDAAQIFANTLPLLADYPAELRQRILPLVAETMARGGQAKAAQALVDRYHDDPTLDLARAMLADSAGQTDDALTRYDRLANGHDRLVRIRAARLGAELRLASGKADAAETAAQLGRMLFAWRGDERELELRLRVAALQAQSNQWRPALSLLRETAAGWPDHAEQLHATLRATFAQAIRPSAQASLKPFDMVALAEENADLMPEGEAGLALAQVVIDQLLALDLPDRAVPYLEKMIATAPRGTARAAFGGKLAALRMEQNDSKAAIEVLTRTSADTLPTPLLESRGIVFASAVAAQGDFPSARQALLELDSAAADRKLAELAEAAKLWPDAESGWRRLAARSLPKTGNFNEDQARLLLRLASAAAEAHDDAALAQLHDDTSARLPPGKTADLFNLLTAPKIQSTSDLGTISHDVALAKAAAL